MASNRLSISLSGGAAAAAILSVEGDDEALGAPPPPAAARSAAGGREDEAAAPRPHAAAASSSPRSTPRAASSCATGRRGGLQASHVLHRGARAVAGRLEPSAATRELLRLGSDTTGYTRRDEARAPPLRSTTRRAPGRPHAAGRCRPSQQVPRPAPPHGLLASEFSDRHHPTTPAAAAVLRRQAPRGKRSLLARRRAARRFTCLHTGWSLRSPLADPDRPSSAAR